VGITSGHFLRYCSPDLPLVYIQLQGTLCALGDFFPGGAAPDVNGRLAGQTISCSTASSKILELSPAALNAVPPIDAIREFGSDDCLLGPSLAASGGLRREYRDAERDNTDTPVLAYDYLHNDPSSTTPAPMISPYESGDAGRCARPFRLRHQCPVVKTRVYPSLPTYEDRAALHCSNPPLKPRRPLLSVQERRLSEPYVGRLLLMILLPQDAKGAKPSPAFASTSPHSSNQLQAAGLASPSPPDGEL